MDCPSKKSLMIRGLDNLGTLPGLFSVACNTLESCARHGLTVNKTKSLLCAKSINPLGYKISQNSIEVDDRKVAAIRNFPEPTNITDLRSFLGVLSVTKLLGQRVILCAIYSKKKQHSWITGVHDEAFETT